jgi:hypothetical protein
MCNRHQSSSLSHDVLIDLTPGNVASLYPQTTLKILRHVLNSFVGRVFMTAFLLCLYQWTSAQVPNVSYSSPQVYGIGSAISTLSPTNSGGTVPSGTFGNVTTYAGSGAAGGSDNTNPLLATFNQIVSIAIDARGNLYVAEFGDGRIRKIAANGVVTTVVDWSTYQPRGIVINGNTGDMYVSLASQVVRLLNSNSANYPAQDPVYSVTAEASVLWVGSSSSGYADGTGSAARFDALMQMNIDAANQYIYIGEYGNIKVRKIEILTGAVTTVTTSGEGLVRPEDVVINAAGEIFVSSAPKDFHQWRRDYLCGWSGWLYRRNGFKCQI